MAKVRVYELAKELSMDSKELVEKLKAGGIPVKNYMSTLDEQTVAKAREVALGVVSEVIEEKRIRPTVIRRRKKTVTVEAEKAPETVEPAVAEAAPRAPVVEAPKAPGEDRSAAAASPSSPASAFFLASSVALSTIFAAFSSPMSANCISSAT